MQCCGGDCSPTLITWEVIWEKYSLPTLLMGLFFPLPEAALPLLA